MGGDRRNFDGKTLLQSLQSSISAVSQPASPARVRRQVAAYVDWVLLGGAAAGSVLSGGLGDLLKQFQQSGQGPFQNRTTADLIRDPPSPSFPSSNTSFGSSMAA